MDKATRLPKLIAAGERVKKKRYSPNGHKATFTKDTPFQRQHDLSRLHGIIAERPNQYASYYHSFFLSRTQASVNNLLATLKLSGKAEYIIGKGWVAL
jgi:hypothetical protein